MRLHDDQRALLREVLAYRTTHEAFPGVQEFRLNHAGQQAFIDELVSGQYLEDIKARYALTLTGLRVCDSQEARQQIAACNALLSELTDVYLAEPGKTWSVDELADKTGGRVIAVARSLTFLVTLPLWSERGYDPETGLVNSVRFSDGILDAGSIDWQDESPAEGEARAAPRLASIEIRGYRPFQQFEAHPGALTVIIGANATGKSSLFDFLRFVSFAASNPLPPEIDPGSAGKMVFHAGGPSRK